VDISSDKLKRFLEEYKTYVQTVLAPTRKEILPILGQWRKPGYWEARSQSDRVDNRVAAPAPVQRVHSRIKRAESVVDKILRRADVFEEGLVPASFRKMNDTLGVRVILYFLDHMPLIDGDLTRKLNDYFEISNDYQPKAYLAEDLTKRLALLHLNRSDKESGYASIHYILRLKQSQVPIEDRPWFELQVRTLTEDTWGEVEHLLGYKPGKRTSFAVRKQFQIISKLLGAIDEHFNLLFQELERFQAEVEYEGTDLLNAEILPPELASLGLGCAQNQIDGLLKLLTSRNITTVLALRNLAQQKSLEIIRSTYTRVKGRPANNFEQVANLANLAGCNEEAEQIKRIEDWIAFLDTWEELKENKFV
jgi:putative GTP pyrophosphokinase